MPADTSGTVIPTEVSASGQFILGGAGLGLVVEQDEQPSPVTLEMAQRMDDLFEAMSPAQQDAVQTHIASSGAVDIVGGLSAMGVLDMNELDPTVRPTSCLSLMLLMLMRSRLF